MPEDFLKENFINLSGKFTAAWLKLKGLIFLTLIICLEFGVRVPFFYKVSYWCFGILNYEFLELWFSDENVRERENLFTSIQLVLYYIFCCVRTGHRVEEKKGDGFTDRDFTGALFIFERAVCLCHHLGTICAYLWLSELMKENSYLLWFKKAGLSITTSTNFYLWTKSSAH